MAEVRVAPYIPPDPEDESDVIPEGVLDFGGVAEGVLPNHRYFGGFPGDQPMPLMRLRVKGTHIPEVLFTRLYVVIC
jgi:hypothetical protein